MTALTQKWPVLGRHEQAATWLTIWTDLGRAPRTIDAYARGLAEYLHMCEREDVDPVTEDEQAAVHDGQTALDRLLDQLADTPTPAGPTPRQLLPIAEIRSGKDQRA